ncbi:MAG: response regulator [Phycisphaerales bacterium]|nr:MAG: response regulator [Phycisphaerales bacterium]
MSADQHILVVDDEEVICQACRRILSPHGFQVDGCTDPFDGLCWAAEKDYAAILLDIKMAGLTGVQLLEQLRNAKPDVPVILITGYPNVRDAAMAIRLGAADYITKPFTPEEIVQAVQCALQRVGQQRDRSAIEARGPAEAWTPVTDEFRFWNESWLQVGNDRSVRVGAVLTGSRGQELKAVELPRISEVVYQGLPLAGITPTDGPSFTIPAPVSGVVLSVNERLPRRPDLLSKEPLKAGWLATICPTRFEEEVDRCRVRNVLLVSSNREVADQQADVLNGLGCRVRVIEEAKTLTSALLDPEEVVIVFDGASHGERGPELVQWINELSPDVRIVVVASRGSRWEAAYRQRKILYYAVEPFADYEIIDVMDAAFRTLLPRSPSPEGPHGVHEPLTRMSITKGSGRTVRLVAAPNLFVRNKRLAALIAARLRDRLYNVELCGKNDVDLTPLGLLNESRSCDHLLVLVTRDVHRLPGSLVRTTFGDVAAGLYEKPQPITTLTVQPAKSDRGDLDFDESTLAALAEHIAEEMSLCYRATVMRRPQIREPRADSEPTHADD